MVLNILRIIRRDNKPQEPDEVRTPILCHGVQSIPFFRILVFSLRSGPYEAVKTLEVLE